jgi:glutamyl-tRNA reductase
VSVVVIGLNHRTAPLDILERMTVAPDRLPKALHDLTSRQFVSEAVVLSTCNRTEVYVVAEKFHPAYQDVRDFLCDQAHLAPEDVGHHLYSYYDDAAVDHLFRVAAGIDSAVIGESEILGQVRQAWEKAQVEGSARITMNMLFRHALEVGKRARTETGIARSITSVSQAAVALAMDRLGSLGGKHVLLVGAGEMGEGMAVALTGAGVAEVKVANRTLDRARSLAERFGGTAVGLIDLDDALAHTDVLLTSTGAPNTLLDRTDVEAVMAQRQGRPLLVVDVAVPRDVDPGVAAIPGVTLLDLDDLRDFADRGAAERQGEVHEVEEIIQVEVMRFLDHSSAREVAPLVASLRERVEGLRSGELDRYRAKLDGLDDRQREAVEAVTRGVLAKLLHEPTVRLKDAAGTPQGERLAAALRHLFDLP